MRRLDVIRATASVATCEVRLSLWHAPSSADVSPLNISTAASRKLPARRVVVDLGAAGPLSAAERDALDALLARYEAT